MWRQAAWQASWQVLTLVSQLQGARGLGERSTDDGFDAAALGAAESFASEVIATARQEVEEEAMCEPPAAFSAGGHPTDGSVGRTGGNGGGGGGGEVDVAFDWAAAMERDAFEAAAMEHALTEDGDDGCSSLPAPTVVVSSLAFKSKHGQMIASECRGQQRQRACTCVA